MKLASSYIPSTKKIPDNEIYTHYHVQINKALRPPGDPHPAREHFDCDRYFYELSDDEIEFYEKLYIPSQSFGSSEGDVLLQEYFGSDFIRRNRIGKNEKLLLDFLRADDRLVVVKAPIGWGKTVLLKYLCFYLIPSSEKLSKQILPIYMSVDDYSNYLNDLEKPKEILDFIYPEVLLPRLVGMTTCYTSLKNESLWSYLKDKTHEFADLREAERDLAEIYSRDLSNISYTQELLSLRRKAKERRDFHLCVARYISDTFSRTPLLIFDNVDPR